MNLNYQLTYKESSVLKNTEITTNYSSGYEEWKKEILSAYQKVNGALAQVQDAFIIKHDKVAENVTCTEYDLSLIHIFTSDHFGTAVDEHGGRIFSHAGGHVHCCLLYTSRCV